MTYVLHPEAEKEHLDAVAYYEARQPGIGAEYLVEFERTLELVCKTPERYPIDREPGVRRVRLRRFPYTIHYRSSGEQVIVLAVAHDRRRPAYWHSRI